MQALSELERDDARKLERVLGRVGWAAAEAALALLPNVSGPGRAQLFALLERLAGTTADPRLFSTLEAGLDDPLPRCRRYAANGLGKLGDPRAEAPLLRALENAPLDVARAIVEGLGKVGSESARAVLAALQSSDAELSRRRGQAELLIARRLERMAEGSLVLDRRLPASYHVRLCCRRGLGAVLASELDHFEIRAERADSVDVLHSGSLRELLVARCALDFAIVVRTPAHHGDPAARLVGGLTEPSTLAALNAWTQGKLRFRIEWTDGAHHRALCWRIAEALSKTGAPLVNDPRNGTWIVRADPQGSADLELVPKLLPDPRFEYRKRDVPAASHPTVAAALARIAGAREDDVVWDPFVGSGLELIERARLGPYRRLIGSDLSSAALEAARENLVAAGLERFELMPGNALELRPADVSLIISNPPMGRRVARDGSLPALLTSFVERLPSLLTAGGRALFLSPIPALTRSVATRVGMNCSEGPEVDLGGFSAELQILTRRSAG